MDKNAIGDRGESIFTSRITEGFLFRVYFLGEKAPIGDFILEINDESTPYECMIQVKSTRTGYNASGNLKAKVSKGKLTKLINRPLPTYVAGVDEIDEKVYICPAYNANSVISSIPTNHILEKGNPVSLITLRVLKEDIVNYWQSINIQNHKTNYNSIL